MCAVPGPTFWTHQNSKNALEVLLLFQWISSKVGWFSLRVDVFSNRIATEINYCHEGFCLFLHHPVLYGRSLNGKSMEIAMEEIDRSSWPSWRFAWFAVGLGDVFQNDKTPKSSHSLSSPKYHARQRKTPSGIWISWLRLALLLGWNPQSHVSVIFGETVHLAQRNGSTKLHSVIIES